MRRLRSLARAARPRVRRRSSPADTLLRLHETVATGLNATASLLGVDHRIVVAKGAAAAPAPAPAAEEPPPPATEFLTQRALRYMSEADIAAYTGALADAGELVFEGPSPPGVEQLVYAHCVKIVLCVLHDALDALPGLGLFGLRVDATQRARGPVDLVGALKRRRERNGGAGVSVDAASVRAFVDRVLEVEREAAGQGALGDVERAMHHNVCTIVVNLAADAASTFRFGLFGHELRVDVAPTSSLDAATTDVLRARRRRGLPRLVDEGRVDALVDEILADENINVSYVPDVVERAFYRRVFNFYSVVLDYVLADASLAVLDVDLDVALVRDDGGS